MTEEAWSAADDPERMLAFLRGKVGDRKVWMLACGCCEVVYRRFCCRASRRALARAREGYSSWEDAIAKGAKAAARTRGALRDVRLDSAYLAAGTAISEDSISAAVHTARRSDYAGFDTDGRDDLADAALPQACRSIRDEQVQLIRCIFGNPFRPITIAPSWLTSTVTSLAQGMYDSRDFSAMPILADALADEGCSDEAILSHCRGNSPHCRGCHVVDALLNKS